MSEPVRKSSPPCAVLLVQHDRARLERLVTDLRQFGIDAHGVQSFEGGREQLVRRRWNVLVADVRLAAFNGLQLAVRVRATQPSVVVIMTDGDEDPALEVEAARLSAHYVPHATVDVITMLVLTACGCMPSVNLDTTSTDDSVGAGV